ncbi:MAG: large conductance mechanosensitive channel protein MscL [Clostridia bacterium]|nr:large conductance mechanosensitive channel protein MscL [Clostridia bacterium]
MAKKNKKGIMAEFKEFIARGNVMNLAVGVIIGGAFQAIVNSLVNDVISPLIGMIGGLDFSEYAVILKPEVLDDAGEVVTEAVTLNYGAFINAIINFFIMAVIIFLLVKFVNKLMSVGKKKEEEPAPAAPTTKVCPFCKSEIAIEATRCAHCTSELTE